MSDAPSAADDWCERLGESLDAGGITGPLITAPLRAGLLRLARDIAHGTERSNAPVAAFIAGRYVEARCGHGVSAETALTEVREIVARLLPDATP